MSQGSLTGAKAPLPAVAFAATLDYPDTLRPFGRWLIYGEDGAAHCSMSVQRGASVCYVSIGVSGADVRGAFSPDALRLMAAQMIGAADLIDAGAAAVKPRDLSPITADVLTSEASAVPVPAFLFDTAAEARS